MGDRDRAERLYEKMLDNDPKSMDALRGLPHWPSRPRISIRRWSFTCA